MYVVEVFFEEEVDKGFFFLGWFLEILLQWFESGDIVEIFMKGYMSFRAKKDYNLAFSKWCISSVCNYFWIYEGGVFLFYFEDG